VSELKKQGQRAFAWDFLGKILTQGSGFVVAVILARLLDPSEFGLIAMVMVIIGIANIFTDMGLGSALIQRESVRPLHYSTVFYFNISAGLLLSILTFCSAELIASFYGQRALVPLTQVLSISFIINALSSTQTTRLRKELDYSTLTRVKFISSLASGLTGLVFAFEGFGVWSLVAQTLTMGVVYNLLIWTSSRWRPDAAFSLKALRELWSFGFHMFLAGMLDAVATRLDYIIIGKLFAADTLGFFQRAKSLNAMVSHNASSSLMAVLFPVLSKVQSDIPRLRRIVINLLGVLSFVTFLLLGGLYIVSHELIVLLFGEKWVVSVDYFKILVISGFAFPLSGLLVNVLSSLGKSGKFLRLEIYKKIFVVANLGILLLHGIHWYLYGLIVVAILGVSLNLVFACREIDVSVNLVAAPIVSQATVTLLSVFAVVYTAPFLQLGLLSGILAKGSMFAALYLLLSAGFRTSAYFAARRQLTESLKHWRE
jgi:teichuronic acid exporter